MGVRIRTDSIGWNGLVLLGARLRAPRLGPPPPQILLFGGSASGRYLARDGIPSTESVLQFQGPSAVSSRAAVQEESVASAPSVLIRVSHLVSTIRGAGSQTQENLEATPA